jgi:putative transposase
MTNPKLQNHHRRSIRLKGYDYGEPGAYFITLVTWHRDCLFGEVQDGKMLKNQFGRLAENEWTRLSTRFTHVLVDAFIVMPDHLHGILVITEKDRDNIRLEDQTSPGNPSITEGGSSRLVGPAPGELGTIVGAYKSATARLINGIRRTPGGRVWQRNYYEHIIRNEQEWERIRAYILANPINYKDDQENR